MRWVDRLRPWSMNEVLLLGILVALTKIAELATRHSGHRRCTRSARWCCCCRGSRARSTRARCGGASRGPPSAGAAAERGSLARVTASRIAARARARVPRLRPALRARGVARTPGTARAAASGLAWRHAARDPAHVGAPASPRRSSTCRPTCCRCSTTHTLVSSAAGHDHVGRRATCTTTGSWPLALIVLDRERDDPDRQDRRARATCSSPCSARSATDNRKRTRLYRIVEFIGRWSMLDVFVDTFVVALVQLSPLMSVEPGPGVVYFMAVVVLTMLAARVVRSAPDLGRGARRPRRRVRWRTEPDGDGDAAAGDGRRPPRRARLLVVWIVPIVAALVAIGIAVQRILSEGPDDHHRLQVGRRHRGRQDVRQVQGRQHRAGDGRAPDRRRRAGRGHREDRQVGGEPHGRGREVLGRAPAHQPVRRVGAVHAAVRQLHRLRGGRVEEEARATFTGLEVPPIITGGTPGRQFVAEGGATWARSASARRSISGACRSARSSPTTSRPTASRCVLRVFVNAPYDKYVTADTRFWNASGIDVSLTANGLDVRTQSLVVAARGRHRVRGAATSTVDGAGRRRHARSRCIGDRVERDEARRVDRDALRDVLPRSRCAACRSARR